MAYDLETVKKDVAEGRALLVDVRELQEWDQGHVRGALLAPLSGLESGVVPLTLIKEKPLFTYCRAGRRSVMGAEILKPLGYNVTAIFEGFDELAARGFPTA